MSSAIKTGLAIVIFFLVAVAVIAAVLFMQTQTLTQQNNVLQGQVSGLQEKEATLGKQVRDLEAQSRALRQDLDTRTQEKAGIQRQLDDAQRNARSVADDLARVKRESEDVNRQVQGLRSERDELIEKLRKRPTEVVEKVVYRDKPADETAAATPSPAALMVEGKVNEDYWAGIMRQKAALEMELEKAKQEMAEAKIKVEEVTKANSDLEVELGRLRNERDEIVRKIKYGEDLADSLSVELARARNDQKNVSDRADKVSAENQALRTEIKQLTTTKVALEKSINRLTDEKNTVEKQLIETEGVIQSRIDDVWKIKKDIDKRFDARGVKGSGEVELAPIVVNAPGTAAAVPVAPAEPAKSFRRTQSSEKPAQVSANTENRSGAIVSINEDNNFVIINIGEKAGVKLGDRFIVQRGNTQLGSVEVIQVRPDISAADIKQKKGAFKPGDLVR